MLEGEGARERESGREPKRSTCNGRCNMAINPDVIGTFVLGKLVDPCSNNKYLILYKLREMHSEPTCASSGESTWRLYKECHIAPSCTFSFIKFSPQFLLKNLSSRYEKNGL